MHIKKFLLSLVCLAGCLAMFLTIPSIKLFSISYITEKDTMGVSLCSDIIIWVYKEENGHTYKRLYNATADTWLTDWILVS